MFSLRLTTTVPRLPVACSVTVIGSVTRAVARTGAWAVTAARAVAVAHARPGPEPMKLGGGEGRECVAPRSTSSTTTTGSRIATRTTPKRGRRRCIEKECQRLRGRAYRIATGLGGAMPTKGAFNVSRHRDGLRRRHPRPVRQGARADAAPPRRPRARWRAVSLVHEDRQRHPRHRRVALPRAVRTLRPGADRPVHPAGRHPVAAADLLLRRAQLHERRVGARSARGGLAADRPCYPQPPMPTTSQLIRKGRT